jgi:hypothetical protein
MITFEDILKKSEPHLINGGRRVRYETPNIIISIVGGSGLYGDFDETFEVALIDKKSGSFISDTLYPEYNDSMGEIMPHITREQMLKVVNELMREKVPAP